MGRGLSVGGLPKVNERGSNLFVDQAIAPNAQPGKRSLRMWAATFPTCQFNGDCAPLARQIAILLRGLRCKSHV